MIWGFKIIATRGTAAAIAEGGIECTVVNKVLEGRPNIVDMLKNGEVQLVVNTVEERRSAINDSRYIRTTSLSSRVTIFTTMAGALASVEGMKHRRNGRLQRSKPACGTLRLICLSEPLSRLIAMFAIRRLSICRNN